MDRKHKILSNETVFSTPWFDVKAKCYHGSQDPYYILKLLDYVSIIAITKDGQILLVEQYRPVVEDNTLELPSGHVEEGESPEEAACRELLEETGYKANKVRLLGTLIPDTGRLGNKMWCYFAPDVVKVYDCPTEADIKLVKCSIKTLMLWIKQGKINHALNIATVHMGIDQEEFARYLSNDKI